MNAFLYRKICTPRSLMIDYTAPAICEGDFTSTGTSTISLLPILRPLTPTGLVMEWNGSFWRLRWNVIPGALCYSIYKLSEFGEFILVAECIFDPFFDLDDFGGGTYKVTVITDDGESDFSDPIDTPSNPIGGGPGPDPVCSSVGDPCPTGAEAFSIVNRLELGEAFPDDPPINEAVDGWNPITWDTFFFTPTTVWLADGRKVYELLGDYPPGHYEVRWLSGFADTSAFPCILPSPPNPPASPGVSTTMAMYYLGDEEFNLPGGSNGLINGIIKYGLDPAFPPPPFSVSIGASGMSRCDASFADAQSGYAAVLGLHSDPAWPDYPASINADTRWRANERHGNTKTTFRAVWDDPGFGAFVDPGFPYSPSLQLVQIDGLIQQARKVQITNWAIVKAGFHADVQAWDGVFNDRSEYTDTSCTWNDPAVGGFGGATVYYTQTHPTASNGAGWVLRIYKGAVIAWEGYKTVGELGTGTYIRSLTSPLPDCIEVENNEIWDYPS